MRVYTVEALRQMRDELISLEGETKGLLYNAVIDIGIASVNKQHILKDEFEEFVKELDLFEHPVFLPKELKASMERYAERMEEEDEYAVLKEMLAETEAEGYTFEYYLDAAPHNLRPIIFYQSNQ